MATNAYTGKTAFETFQTLNYGDRIWPDVELMNWQKVENRFLSMNLDNFVISHGTFAYVINPLDETDVHVTLSPNGLDSAFAGSINGCYFRINTVMTWEMSITVDGTYYLYLKEVTGQTDPTSDLSLEKEYTQTEYSGSDLKTRILMAIVTRTGGVLQTIVHDPPTQMTSQHFYDHVFDTVDPHGSLLTQTNLTVTNATAGTARITNLNATNVTAASVTATNVNVTGSITAPSAVITSMTATTGHIAGLTSVTGSFKDFYTRTGRINNLSATAATFLGVTGTTGNITSLNSTSAVISSITGTTGYFGNLSCPTASITSLSATGATIDGLTAGTASVSSLFIGGTTAYRELIYEQGYNPTSASEVDLNAIAGILNATAQPVFISASVLSPIQTGLYFKYSGLLGEVNKYVVYNDNTTGVTGRMFVKYQLV